MKLYKSVYLYTYIYIYIIRMTYICIYVHTYIYIYIHIIYWYSNKIIIMEIIRRIIYIYTCSTVVLEQMEYVWLICVVFFSISMFYLLQKIYYWRCAYRLGCPWIYRKESCLHVDMSSHSSLLDCYNWHKSRHTFSRHHAVSPVSYHGLDDPATATSNLQQFTRHIIQHNYQTYSIFTSAHGIIL